MDDLRSFPQQVVTFWHDFRQGIYNKRNLITLKVCQYETNKRKIQETDEIPACKLPAGTGARATEPVYVRPFASGLCLVGDDGILIPTGSCGIRLLISITGLPHEHCEMGNECGFVALVWTLVRESFFI